MSQISAADSAAYSIVSGISLDDVASTSDTKPSRAAKNSKKIDRSRKASKATKSSKKKSTVEKPKSGPSGDNESWTDIWCKALTSLVAIGIFIVSLYYTIQGITNPQSTQCTLL